MHQTITRRLRDLRELEDGWLDGKGVALDEAGLYWLAGTFAIHYDDDLPAPVLYPTPTGGIRGEWALYPLDISLHISLADKSGTWHLLNTRDDSEVERTLDLTAPEDWQYVCAQIRDAVRLMRPHGSAINEAWELGRKLDASTVQLRQSTDLAPCLGAPLGLIDIPSPNRAEESQPDGWIVQERYARHPFVLFNKDGSGEALARFSTTNERYPGTYSIRPFAFVGDLEEPDNAARST